MAENELKITDTFIEWKNKFNKSLNDVSVYGLRVEALDTLQTQHYNELKSADSDLTTKYNELNTKYEDLTAKYNNFSANVANVDSKYKKAINACIAYSLILGDNSTLKLPADFDLVQAYNYVNSLNNSSNSGSTSSSSDSGSGTESGGSGSGTESGGSGSGTESGGSGSGTESGGSGSDSGTTFPEFPNPPTPEDPPA